MGKVTLVPNRSYLFSAGTDSFLDNSKSQSNLINVLFLFGVDAFDELVMIPTIKTLKSETK